MKRILFLSIFLSAALLVGIVPAYAADIDAAQMVQIDQTGTRNNVDITSGVVNTVDTVTTVNTVNYVGTITRLNSIQAGTVTIQGRTGVDAIVESDGSLRVKSQAELGTVKTSYTVSTAVAAGTEIDAATFSVTAGKTLYLNTVGCVASGLATVRILSGAVEIMRVYTSPTQQTAIVPVYQGISVAAATVVTVKVKNREASAMDVTGFLIGMEK